MIGWERVERDWLFAFLSDTARPWPKHAVLAWLRYAHNARKRGVQIQTPTREGGWVLQGALLSGRDLAEAVGLTYKVTRSLMESDAWADFSDEKGTDLAPARAQQGRNEGAERAQQGRNEGAKRVKKSASKADRETLNGRNEGAERAQQGRNEGAARALARAFPLTPTATETATGTGAAPDLVPSPPPAEPSDTSERWTQAAEIIEADPEAWRASEEFQPSSDAYVFDDAEPVGVPEQPSDPRQSESPICAVKTTAKATPDVASTSPAQPSDPAGEFTPSPPPSASPAARPRGSSGEGDPTPVAPPQSAPSLFGRTDTAPEAPAPAKAPPRARKVQASTKAADALAVYAAWRVYHPRAAEAPTPDTVKDLGRILTEAGGPVEALLLIEWAHKGTCERARQLRGEAPWPDGRTAVYTDLNSLSRKVAGRLEMARGWKERSTDKASGLNVIHLDSAPRGLARGPDRISAISRLLQQEYQNADH